MFDFAACNTGGRIGCSIFLAVYGFCIFPMRGNWFLMGAASCRDKGTTERTSRETKAFVLYEMMWVRCCCCTCTCNMNVIAFTWWMNVFIFREQYKLHYSLHVYCSSFRSIFLDLMFQTEWLGIGLGGRAVVSAPMSYSQLLSTITTISYIFLLSGEFRPYRQHCTWLLSHLAPW